MEMPTQAELLTQYAGKPVQELFEFTLTPDAEYGVVDWETHVMLYGPHYRLEESDYAVRVTVAPAVPRGAVVSALRQVIKLLELTESLKEGCPPQLEVVAKWFNS